MRYHFFHDLLILGHIGFHQALRQITVNIFKMLCYRILEIQRAAELVNDTLAMLEELKEGT